MLGFVASPAYVSRVPRLRPEPTSADLAEQSLAEALSNPAVACLLAACRDALACDFRDGGACCAIADAVAAMEARS